MNRYEHEKALKRYYEAEERDHRKSIATLYYENIRNSPLGIGLDVHEFLLEDLNLAHKKSNFKNLPKRIPASVIVDATDIIEPPRKMSKWLAAENQLVLFYGREKIGKSTFITSDIVHAAKEGNVVFWVSFEEQIGLIGNRLAQLDVESHVLRNIDVMFERLTEWNVLAQEIKKSDPDIIYIDSLAALVASLEGRVPDHGQSEMWTRLMRKIRAYTTDQGIACVLIHHSPKDRNDYRGSTAIAGEVDEKILFKGYSGRNPNHRELKHVGRWHVYDELVEYFPETGWYETYDKPAFGFDEAPLSREDKILEFIRENDGCSTFDIRKNVAGSPNDIIVGVQNLEEEGMIKDLGSGRIHAWTARQ